MFAQLGTIVFDGLQTFVSYNTQEEIALAQFMLINRKPKLMAAALGLFMPDECANYVTHCGYRFTT